MSARTRASNLEQSIFTICPGHPWPMHGVPPSGPGCGTPTPPLPLPLPPEIGGVLVPSGATHFLSVVTTPFTLDTCTEQCVPDGPSCGPQLALAMAVNASDSGSPVPSSTAVVHATSETS